MLTTEQKPPLDLHPRRFVTAIRTQEGFLESLPTENFRGMEPSKKREHLQRAIASSAFTIANEREQTHGDSDLDAHLFRLVGSLGSFYEGAQTLDTLGQRYRSRRDMSPGAARKFATSKEDVISFNHTLREVINVGASKLSFDDLLQFMVKMHVESGGRESMQSFEQQARNRLVGMRDEMAFEQMLIAGDVNYRIGEPEEDAIGGDFIVEGIPIDVKSSEFTARDAKRRATERNRNPHRIIWSHIRPQDYNGRLTLTYDQSKALFSEIEPELAQAIPSYERRSA